MLDAYTVRKIAPRLLVAAIAVNLSIYLCVAAIDISNVIGHSLANLLVTPFAEARQLNTELDAGGGNLAGGFLLIAVALPGLVISSLALSGGAVSTIFFTLLPLVLIILAILIIVVIRQVLLVLLTIISPIAFVCLVLPGTEKYFKQWWDLFLKTLLLYPIIAALFALSNIMALISFNAASADGIAASNLQSAAQIVGGVVLSFMPLVLIPFAFRFAGGAIGAIMGSTKGLMHSVNRFSGRQRQQALGKGWEKTKAGNFIRTPRNSGVRARVNRMTQGAAMIGTGNVTPGRFRTAMSDQRFAGGGAMMEDATFKNMMKDDDVIRAGLHSRDAAGANAWLEQNESLRFGGDHNAAKRQDAVDRIMQLKRRHGDDTFKQGGFRALSTNSTAWDDWSEMESDLHAASGSDHAMQLELSAAALEGQKASGRMDIGGGSISNFITQADAMRKFRSDNPNASAAEVAARSEQAGDDYYQSVIERNGGAALVSGKPKSAAHVAKAYRKRIDDVANSIATDTEMKFYNPETESHENRIATEKDLIQTMASVESTREGLGYVSTEAQTAFSDIVMDHRVTANGIVSADTVSQTIEGYRGNEQFRTMKREYGASDEQQAAAQIHAQNQGGQPGAGAPPNPGAN